MSRISVSFLGMINDGLIVFKWVQPGCFQESCQKDGDRLMMVHGWFSIHQQTSDSEIGIRHSHSRARCGIIFFIRTDPGGLPGKIEDSLSSNRRETAENTA